MAQEQPEFRRCWPAQPWWTGPPVWWRAWTHRPLRPWQDVLCLGDTATMIPPLCGDSIGHGPAQRRAAAPLTSAYLTGALSEAA
ncbi:MAG: hypothetical protein R2854_12165 [Caldilineaceae bacterium]